MRKACPTRRAIFDSCSIVLNQTVGRRVYLSEKKSGDDQWVNWVTEFGDRAIAPPGQEGWLRQ